MVRLAVLRRAARLLWAVAAARRVLFSLMLCARLLRTYRSVAAALFGSGCVCPKVLTDKLRAVTVMRARQIQPNRLQFLLKNSRALGTLAHRRLSSLRMTPRTALAGGR